MTKATNSYSIPFLLLCLALVVFGMVMMNDFLSIWPGAEAWSLDQALAGEGWQFWTILQGLIHTEQWSSFWVRFPNLIISLGLGTLSYFWCRKLFGKFRTWTLLLVLASSLLFSNIQKIGSADISLAWFQWLAFLAFLRYVKNPSAPWLLATAGFLLLSIWANPFQSLIWSIGLFGVLFVFHKERAKMLRSGVWALPIVLGIVLLVLNQMSFISPQFYTGWGADWTFGRNLLMHLIGVLPWLGFLAPGLWELQKRLRKGEELAILQFAALLAGLINPGLFLCMALAFIVMRQVADYAHPNYPHKGLAQTFAITHLVLVFVIGVVSMIWGFTVIGGLGFRTFMAIILPYWIASFLTVSGMVASDSRYYIGAPIMAGLLFTATTWIQLGPVLETRRNLPKKVSEFIEKDPQFNAPLHLQINDVRQSKVYELYGERTLPQVIVAEGNPLWSGTYLIDSLNLIDLKASASTILLEKTFENWEGLGKKGKYWLVNCSNE